MVPVPTRGPTGVGTSPAGTRVVLASGSPRRRELLAQAGIGFDVRPAPFDDADLLPGTDHDPAHWAAALAFLKAKAVADGLGAGYTGPCVLAADTIVVHRGVMIGKPADGAHAERMIRGLMDAEHEVVTGCAVIEPATGYRKIFTDTARVWMGRLSDEQIRRHVESGAWRGKAGGYNLDEQIAAGWPIRTEGDPGTVMGLPMTKLKPVLAALAARGGGGDARGPGGSGGSGGR
jgi:septum formation protein